MALALAVIGVFCVAGGFALAIAPRRVLRLDPELPSTTALRAVRGAGLALMVAGSFLVATSLVPQTPLVPRTPTPTPIRRMV